MWYFVVLDLFSVRSGCLQDPEIFWVKLKIISILSHFDVTSKGRDQNEIMADDGRPVKKPRLSADDVASDLSSQGKQQKRKGTSRNFSSQGGLRKSTDGRSKKTQTFSQPSVICSGDKGVFVTCDKGREKKSLLEFEDILANYLEQGGLDAEGEPVQKNDVPHESDDSTAHERITNGIEADIAAELDNLRNTCKDANPETRSAKTIQLITLDIPCVSFVRFPPSSQLDPVHVVHEICLRAADPASPQQSRFIKRLTPISNLGKALGQGLERACESVLPKYFGTDSGIVKFAIKPTVRNNDKLNRDMIIKLVAGKVQEFGQNKHKVDLKGYERGVLVEVYRGWVGMSVVHNGMGESYKLGYEQLKKFNISEIYASR